ncbi:MAG: PEP-CTERM sorting domain-containing protein [Opitutales bacterium]
MMGTRSRAGAIMSGEFASYGACLSGGSPVPEPSSYALMGGLGALGLALVRRRERKSMS